MPLKRIRLPIAIAALLAAHVAAADDNRADMVRRIDASVEKATRYLIAAQSPDGAWRSETYGALRDGPSLTPFVISGLWFLPQAGPEGKTAFRKGADYLMGFVDEKGQLRVGPRELLFPVYTAACASRMIVHAERSPRYLRAQQAWLAYLRGRQLNEALGWQPSDLEYGGWGFSLDVPRKPPPGRPKELLCESNLAATIFAVAALRSAKTPDDDPAFRQALGFVERCQNFGDDAGATTGRGFMAEAGDLRYDDGGFFFIPNDAAQNKAGVAGTDRHGRERYHSYGTMTADGLRALLRCGLSADHPRVVAARKWLQRNFSPKCNPGAFPADRAVLQDATYYYWTWASAHAFLALGETGTDQFFGEKTPGTGPFFGEKTPLANSRQTENMDLSPSGKLPAWPQALAEELLRRQQADGTWVNRYTDAKEDDPLIATSWAAASLAICRAMLSAEQKPTFKP